MPVGVMLHSPITYHQDSSDGVNYDARHLGMRESILSMLQVRGTFDGVAQVSVVLMVDGRRQNRSLLLGRTRPVAVDGVACVLHIEAWEAGWLQWVSRLHLSSCHFHSYLARSSSCRRRGSAYVSLWK